MSDKVSYTLTNSPVTLKMTGLFLCPGKKEVEIKMIIIVLVVRIIISMFEKNKKKKLLKNLRTVSGSFTLLNLK